MRKFVILGALVLAGLSLAFTPPVWVDKSGNQTATATILSTSGYLYGIQVSTSAGQQGVINCYNSTDSEITTSPSSTKLFPQWTVKEGTYIKMRRLWFNPPVACDGIRVVLSGSVSGYEVYYRAS